MFKLDPFYRDATQGDIDKNLRTRLLNDAFRRELPHGGVHLSPSVVALPRWTQAAVVNAVKSFEDFEVENDPYEERDFGAVVVGGERYFWKIEYYDLDMLHGSLDTSDPAFTIRIMAVMKSGEY